MSAVIAVVLLIIAAAVAYILFATGKLSFSDDKKEPPVTINDLVLENKIGEGGGEGGGEGEGEGEGSRVLFEIGRAHV